MPIILGIFAILYITHMAEMAATTKSETLIITMS
jgi:hypothetical protein